MMRRQTMSVTKSEQQFCYEIRTGSSYSNQPHVRGINRINGYAPNAVHF